jgi:hypothetical protein
LTLFWAIAPIQLGGRKRSPLPQFTVTPLVIIDLLRLPRR